MMLSVIFFTMLLGTGTGLLHSQPGQTGHTTEELFVMISNLSATVTLQKEELVHNTSTLNAIIQNLTNELRRQNDIILRQNVSILRQNAIITKQNFTIANILSQNNHGIAFYALLNKDLSFVGDGQTIEFETVVTNVGNAYDSRHSHFTAPVNGLYMFAVGILSTTGHAVHVGVVKNGIVVAKLYSGSADYESDTQVFPLELVAGDMMWVKHIQDGETSAAISSYNSYFAGYLIKEE